MNPLFLPILFSSLFCVAVAQAADAPRPEKPNIVLILTDDLGWQDVKCYDIDEPSPMETPNIDALAKQGTMFWQAYSPAPTCAPSRCAIMSGNHPARAQKTHVVGGHPPSPYFKNAWPMISPWYSGRMPENEITLAKVLAKNGYTTGHNGKWHMAIDHHAFPQPLDQGFQWSKSERGSRSLMRSRTKGFATNKENDAYKLDENGFPYHSNSVNALSFMEESKAKPFFLYYATWLVHTPIHTRSEELLNKYCNKLNIDPATLKDKGWKGKGQTNPFYCAMVEELDYYMGKVFNYLDQTDDPRWPGHKLSENTYLIFTSDNGGMTGYGYENFTDNAPLSLGKKSALEGGTRVPLIITGPEVPEDTQSDVMVNGLDFYPTILSLTGTDLPEGKTLDGCDLAKLITSPKDHSLVTHPNGTTRNSMMWHFPNDRSLESALRVGDYKLVRNYQHINDPETPELELFQLYKTEDGQQTRLDIEEAHNLAETMPEKTEEMNQLLTVQLTEMKASYPYYNPHYKSDLPHKDKVCTVTQHTLEGQNITVTYKENGAKVTKANLLYTLNGGKRYEEWFRIPATVNENNTVTANIPDKTTHIVLNLIDENNFLRSYPELPDKNQIIKGKEKYSPHALKCE